MKINISKPGAGKKVYFASDFHLGSPNYEESFQREQKIVRWLNEIKSDAQALILVGDLFDFWFEYRKVAPKGYIRFLGKLAELSDVGVKIYIFIGNHDLWYKDYLPIEIGTDILVGPTRFNIGDKDFYIAHGDGLGKGQTNFLIVKWFFTNPVCQWLFGWLHPDVGIWLANLWSGESKKRMSNHEKSHQVLIEYSQSIEDKQHHDFYVYGDCHDATVRETHGITYINLGDWLSECSYGEFDGDDFVLKTYKA